MKRPLKPSRQAIPLNRPVGFVVVTLALVACSRAKLPKLIPRDEYRGVRTSERLWLDPDGGYRYRCGTGLPESHGAWEEHIDQREALVTLRDVSPCPDGIARTGGPWGLQGEKLSILGLAAEQTRPGSVRLTLGDDVLFEEIAQSIR
ncbi:MAG: hypothetical protein JST54_11275 [Deltaproteobacteria bacterium]|nr:hypothetical protein [Deltaproteobacteria bacterium]